MSASVISKDLESLAPLRFELFRRACDGFWPVRGDA
jgi:hypothetical protein